MISWKQAKPKERSDVFLQFRSWILRQTARNSFCLSFHVTCITRDLLLICIPGLKIHFASPSWSRINLTCCRSGSSNPSDDFSEPSTWLTTNIKYSRILWGRETLDGNLEVIIRAKNKSDWKSADYSARLTRQLLIRDELIHSVAYIDSLIQYQWLDTVSIPRECTAMYISFITVSWCCCCRRSIIYSQYYQ